MTDNMNTLNPPVLPSKSAAVEAAAHSSLPATDGADVATARVPADNWGAESVADPDPSAVPVDAAEGSHPEPDDGILSYSDFEKMGLEEQLLRGVYSYGFEKPSMIQQKAIVPAAAGRDVVMHAQSGTGKTGAFGIGLLARIDPALKRTQALVLSPTRDLADQTHRVIRALGDYLGATVHCSIGGRSGRNDAEKLRQRPIVVTGTPGRVLDNIINRRVLDTSGLKVVVLDECDVMLSEGFYRDMKILFDYLPHDCQVIVVSATMPPEVLKLTEQFMRNPVKVLIPKEEITLRGIAQFFVDCGYEDDKYAVLADLYDKLSVSQSVVFVNTRRTAMMLTDAMNRDDHTVSCIHSDMEQSERDMVLKEFTNGASRVLIATDVLARGIDVQQVSVVMNFDLPRDKENYIHRIGRGGRFGRKAVAINLVTQRDAAMINEIERYYATEIQPMPDNVQDYT